MNRDDPGATPPGVHGSANALRERFAGEVVLLTGYPGFLAQALVRVLAEREPDAELWLVVPPGQLERAARELATTTFRSEQLRLIPGEPCAIDLGLSRQTYGELAQRVDRWFSLYQTSDARAPRELCFRANLGSAREIVQLSQVAESLANVTFLSSYVVFGDHQGEAGEDELVVGQRFRSVAAESLALAESVLWRKLADVPLSIVRAPQILGERAAELPARTSGLHRLLALVASAPAEAALPLPPGSSRLVRALPADFVAQAVYAVSVLGTRGHRYHVSDPDPPSLRDLLEQAASHFGKRLEHGFDALAIGRILLNSPGLWLAPQASRALSEMADGASLSTRGGDRLLERAGLRAPSVLSYLDVLLRQTEELVREQRLEETLGASPFEVVA